MVSKPIKIGNGAFIGIHSTILGGVTIGAHTIIGAGSVVTHDIPSGVVAYGVPCKPRRKLSKSDYLKHLS